MAKGDDSSKSAMGAGVPPKMDQYSVMHGIMDRLGSAGGSMAPGVMGSIAPSSPPQMGGPINSGGQAMPRDNSMGNFGSTIGSMAPMISGVGQAGSMAPTNPQDLIRRTMIGKGAYAQ
jgi:hypothetical protein